MVPKCAAEFPIGVKVEVCNNTAGFRGSWYEATIVRAIRRRRSYDIEYVSRIANDDPTQPLRKTVLGSLVRPWRLGKVSIARYAVRDHVDAYHNGGWRRGVVSASHGGDPPGRYTVRFTVGCKEEMEFSPAEIRPHLEWRHGHWCPPENQVAQACPGGGARIQAGSIYTGTGEMVLTVEEFGRGRNCSGGSLLNQVHA